MLENSSQEERSAVIYTVRVRKTITLVRLHRYHPFFENHADLGSICNIDELKKRHQCHKNIGDQEGGNKVY